MNDLSFWFQDKSGVKLLVMAHEEQVVTISTSLEPVVEMPFSDAIRLRNWLNDVLLDAE